MLSQRDYGKLLCGAIEAILEYFGVCESTIEEQQSCKHKGTNIFVKFRDNENKPWIIAFFWPDTNWLLEEKAYTKKVYEIAKTIILDFIQQGAALEEHAKAATHLIPKGEYICYPYHSF